MKDKEEMSEKEKKKFNLKIFLQEQSKTLPLKLIILTFCGGAIAVFPFLVLQMQLLGINIREIALIYLIIPIAALLGPICSGLLADKLGKYSVVFFLNTVLAGASYNMMLLVPPIDKVGVNIHCNAGSLAVSFDPCNDCFLALENEVRALTLQNCKPCFLNEQLLINEEGCIEELALKEECPVFNENNKVFMNVTKHEKNITNFCELKVNGVRQDNLIYGNSSSKCRHKRECDFKCEVEENIEECAASIGSSKTFQLALGCMFFSNFFIAASFTMMDAAILQYVAEYKVDLGKQRIMSMVGFSITPLIAGALIDYHSKQIGTTTYFAAFMLADALFAVAAIFILFIDLKVEVSNSNVFKDLGNLVTRIEVDVFLLIALILGCNFGFIESYLFIFLNTLDPPNFLLGLTLTVGCVSSIPMLFYADRFEKKVGRQNVFLICFTAYAARMLGYSYIQNPWLCLIFETLEAFTYQLMWVTILRLCPILAPKGLLATMTGLVGSIHYSFGKGIGGFLGGFIIKSVGIRSAFRVFAGIAFGGAIIYTILHYTFLKKRIEYREKLLKEEEELSKKEEVSPMLINEKSPLSSGENDDLNKSPQTITSMGHRLSNASSPGGEFRPSSDVEEGENNTIKSRRNSIKRRSLYSGSMPYLYVADAYDLVDLLDSKDNSNSEGNMLHQ